MKRKTDNAGTAETASARRGARVGFSLIEVNLVLLIVGVGLVALLGLFPVGLRQAGLATGDKGKIKIIVQKDGTIKPG